MKISEVETENKLKNDIHYMFCNIFGDTVIIE